MHIILAILGALAAAFWAFTHFVNATNESREAIGDAKSVIRRGKWNRRIDQRLIENLSDPREAASVLLYQVAQYDGAVTEKQTAHIIENMCRIFDADQETAEGLFAFGRMAVGEINDASNSIRKILGPIVAVCSQDEKNELIALLEETAEIEGPATDIQRHLIAEVKRGVSSR